jgi:small subunit ribosomal protein S4
MEQKRRPYPPGEHGFGRHKTSEYGLQLREKQKVRRIYGILEKQFRSYFVRADRQKGVTGENLLRILELRLDNVIYRLGFASSRAEARQLVRHRHFLVNGKRVNIPSLQVREGDAITVMDDSKKILPIVGSLEVIERRGVPAWLELNKSEFQGVVKQLPTREDIQLDINERLIVELYSK